MTKYEEPYTFIANISRLSCLFAHDWDARAQSYQFYSQMSWRISSTGQTEPEGSGDENSNHGNVGSRRDASLM